MILQRNVKLDPVELNELLATNQWDVKPISKLEQCLNTSWGNVCARDDNGKLIGYVRVLSDGIRHAYICSLIVHPDHRRKGIGAAILKDLLAMIDENHLYPTLVASPGEEDYYAKFGFEVQSNGYTAMCIRK